MEKDRIDYSEQVALRVRDREWDDTVIFFHNANEIYARFDEWKDNDLFYFIPMKMRLLYARPPGGMFMVPDPVFLGTYIRNNLKYSNYFSASCPDCGRKLYPYHINGCPTSERVDLQLSCDDCGWKGIVRVEGWHFRSRMLKVTQAEDQLRMDAILLLNRDFKAANIKDLIGFLKQ